MPTSTLQMKKEHVIAGLISFSVILGWNVFLIQRDDSLYKAHYRQQAIQQMK